MTGRRWLLGAAAGLAALAGLGWSRWRGRDEPGEADAAGLWSLGFPTPEGGTLALASLRGRPLVLNFWATWCAPCIREMPQLDRFARQFGPNGWQVVGIALDTAEPVKEFLMRQPVSYPIALAGFAGVELSRRLGNSQGSLPFTVLFAANGRVLDTHLGEMRFEDLARWAQSG